MLHQSYDKCAQCERHCIVSTMGDGRVRMPDSGDSVLHSESSAGEEEFMAASEHAVSSRVVGFKDQCSFQQGQGFSRPLRHPGEDVGKRAHDEVVSIETFRPFSLHALDFRVTQARYNRSEDPQGDLLLVYEELASSGRLAISA